MVTRSSNRRLAIAAALLATATLGACAGDASINTGRTPSASGPCQPGTPGCVPAIGATSGDPLAGEGDGMISYPRMTFRGSGTLTRPHSTISSAAITQEPVTTETSATELRVTIGSFTSSNSDVSSRLAGKAGTTVYQRSTREEIQAAVSARKIPNSSFMIFASRASTPSGRVYQFTTPFPAFLVPAAASRYDSIGTGQTFQSELVGFGPISMKVTRDATNGGTITITARITTGFGADADGNFWADFPMPQTATYQVDTTSSPRVITSLSTNSLYMSNNKGSQPVDLSFTLCRYEQDGQPSKDYPCY